MSVSADAEESAAKTACITLDLENNWNFEADHLKYLVFDYLDEYIELIQSVDVPVTVFVVGEVFEDRPEVVRALDEALDVEFHLHSYSHDMTGNTAIEREIRHGVRAFADVRGQRPTGYRAPRFIVNDGDLRALADAGFTFDSSVCPSYRPGVYNNLGAPTEPYYPSEAPTLLELPISVHPRLKVPFSQSYLRLLGRPYVWLLRYSELPEPLVFDSHLHDFFETKAHAHLSGLKKRLFTTNIDSSKHLFKLFVTLLRNRGYEFGKLSTMVRQTKAERPPQRLRH